MNARTYICYKCGKYGKTPMGIRRFGSTNERSAAAAIAAVVNAHDGSA